MNSEIKGGKLEFFIVLVFFHHEEKVYIKTIEINYVN